MLNQTFMPARTVPIPMLPVFVFAFLTLVGFAASRFSRVEQVFAELTTYTEADAAVSVAADSPPIETVAVHTASVAAPTGKPAPLGGGIAAAFAPSVQYWAGDIVRWAAANNLDPNLVATVMQIESCGDPQAMSGAGARGLFQVMPFHFAAGEDMFDPDTNAARGMAYLALGLETANGNAGLALAGYNGGHSVIGRSSDTWHNETQRYYTWGNGIFTEVSANPEDTTTLDAWMQTGGNSLCSAAEANLGINR